MSSRHCDFTFPEKMLFVEIVAIHCVLRQIILKLQRFCVFLTSRVDFQRAGRIFKLMQNRTHHKTTPNSTSERPSGLTVSVTLEDAWFPKQTWGWPPEVAKEQGWQVLRRCYTSACNPSAVPSPPPPRSPRPLPPPLPPRAENDWIVTIVLYCYSSQHTNHTWEWTGWWFSEHLWGGHDGDYQRHLSENIIFYVLIKFSDVML